MFPPVLVSAPPLSQRGRIGRLLEAFASNPGLPGMGIDSEIRIPRALAAAVASVPVGGHVNRRSSSATQATLVRHAGHTIRR